MLQTIRSEGHYRQSIQNYFNPLIDKLFNCNIYTLKVFLHLADLIYNFMFDEMKMNDFQILLIDVTCLKPGM